MSDIYIIEAQRRFRDSTHGAIDMLAITLRELNWQPPVDPDLIEARKLTAHEYSIGGPFYAASDEIRQGKKDDKMCVRTALAGIKRGRELAAAGGAA